MGNKQVPLLRLYRFKEAFSLTLALELVQRFRLTTDDLRQRMVGLKGHGKQRLFMYARDMRQSLAEMARVLTPSA